MNLDLSSQELEILKELIESSINRITTELQHSKTPQKKIELKEHRDELIEIFKKIESTESQQAS